MTTRPPYGETGAPFVLESARALLANTEHEPPDQTNSDALWVELRLACDEVERLQEELRQERTAREHHQRLAAKAMDSRAEEGASD